MIRGWKKSTLGEACLIEKGKSSAANEPVGPYPLVTTGAERKSAATWQFEGPAVCVPMISAYGHGKPGLKHVHYQEGKFALANILSALLIKNPKELSAKFLAAFLNFYKDHLIVPLQFGAANMSITTERLATIPIWYPSLGEQERIVCLLDEAEALRQLRTQASARMAAFVPALFHEMFSDFSNHAQVQVSDLASVQGGLQLTPKRNEYMLKRPYLRVANVQRGHLLLDEIKEIGLLEAEFNKTKLKDGDILVVEGNGNPEEIGRAAMWSDQISGCVHQNHLIRIRCDQGKLLPDYLVVFLNSNIGRKYFLKSGNTTSGLVTISTRIVKSCTIPLPPVALQREFAQRVQEAREIQSRQAGSAERIEALYQSMLSQAFAGEL